MLKKAVTLFREVLEVETAPTVDVVELPRLVPLVEPTAVVSQTTEAPLLTRVLLPVSFTLPDSLFEHDAY